MSTILDRFFAPEDSRRPELAWENLEDLIYHDTYYHDPRLDDSFELCAFLHRVWTFNRAMRWRRWSGTVLAHAVGGPLRLTGEDAVSTWHTGTRNEIAAAGARTRWTQGSHRRRDGLVLPTFQLHLGQHPRLRIEVAAARGSWQAVVALKGRSGRPLWASEWNEGPASLTVPLAELIAARGGALQFAEIHLALGTWNEDPAAAGMLEFEAVIEAEPALVAALPVIRGEAAAAEAGVPIVFAALDADGEPLGPDTVAAVVRGPGEIAEAHFEQGLWSTVVAGLGPGEHRFELETRGALHARRELLVRVAPPPPPERGALSGSYHGSVFVVSPGEPDEHLVQGQREWDERVVRERGGWDRLHYWDALTEPELRARFEYLRDCGWDLLHLHSHWAMWARFDVGGHLSPRIAEQAALFYRTAAANGMQVVQTLADYPYGTAREPGVMPDSTPPFSSYIEAGFRDGDWFDPESDFAARYAEYLAEYVEVFREESALYALTQSGEADHVAGAARVNATERILREHGDEHRYLVQPVLRLTDLPETFSAGYPQELQGARTYWIGEEHEPHHDLGAEMKLIAMGGMVVAEASFSMTNQYARLHGALGDDRGAEWSWSGSQHHRLRLRDTLYLALVHSIGLVLTWDEQIDEEEHRVFAEAARLAPWSATAALPAEIVALVDGGMLTGHRRHDLVACEAWFAARGLRYRLASAEPASGEPVLDLRDGFSPERAAQLAGERRFEVSPGYCCAWTESGDGGFLAYLYNSGRCQEQEYWSGGRFHRVPMPAVLRAQPPEGRRGEGMTVFDLTTKRPVTRYAEAEDGSLSFGPTTHDYLLVRPGRDDRNGGRADG